jgi:hypothetical protein
MAIEYTIKINSARVQDDGELADVVKEVDISLTGTDGPCSFTLPFTVKMPAPDASAFIAYGELTEAQIVSWVLAQDDMLQPRRDHIAMVVEKEMEKAALTSKKLPWEPLPEPPAAPIVPAPLANPEE